MENKKGFNVIEAYTDDPNVGNTTTSIKNYLQNLYNNPGSNNPPSYILLVGDVNEIPSFSGTQGNHVRDFITLNMMEMVIFMQMYIMEDFHHPTPRNSAYGFKNH